MKKEVKKLIKKYYKDHSCYWGDCIYHSAWWVEKLRSLGFHVKARKLETFEVFHHFLFIDGYIFDPTYRQFFFNPDELPPIFFGTKEEFKKLLEQQKSRYHEIYDYVRLYKLG